MVVWYGTILLEIIVYSTQSICSSSLIILFPNVNLVFVLSHQRKFHIYGWYGTTIPPPYHWYLCCCCYCMLNDCDIMMEFKLLEPLGVEIELPQTEEQWKEIPAIMHQGRGVLVVKDLDVAPNQLEDVLKRFQHILGHQLLKYDRWPGQSPGIDGCPHLALLGNYKARGENDAGVKGCSEGDPIAEFKPATLELSEWHTDGSFLSVPKSYIALYAPMNVKAALPAEGGETRFASTELTSEEVAKYRDWSSVHSWRAFMRFLEARDPARPKVTDEDCAKKPDQLWPLVRHGKYLYINPKNTSTIFDDAGKPVDNNLVYTLAQRVLDSGVYAHKWRPGDLLLWNNQRLLHAATPFDSQKYERLLYRAEFGPHYIRSSVDTVVWGYLEPRKPIKTVQSGSVVVVDTVSGSMRPPNSFSIVPKELLEIQDTITDRLGPHILTGPIAIAGAEPGDVLQIDILDVKMRSDWAFTLHKKSGQLRHTRLCSKAGGYAETTWGSRVDCQPFFGVLGVATAERVSSVPPSTSYGGNLDLKLLTAGSTLYIPIHQKDALLFVGDGHARQGDGECCGTALETSLRGTFRLTVLKNNPLKATRAETESALISIGVEDSVDKAVNSALDHMVEWILELRPGMSTVDAECLCSIAGDIAVTQIVNGITRGAHVILQKSHLPPV